VLLTALHAEEAVGGLGWVETYRMRACRNDVIAAGSGRRPPMRLAHSSFGGPQTVDSKSLRAHGQTLASRAEHFDDG
jgi:hypothetical protein